ESSDIVRVGRAVAPTVAQQLRDSDALVRRTASDTVHGVADALLRYTPPTNTSADRTQEQNVLRKAWNDFLPVAALLAEDVPALGHALDDSDLDARLAANRAIEMVADVRLRYGETARAGDTTPVTP